MLASTRLASAARRAVRHVGVPLHHSSASSAALSALPLGRLHSPPPSPSPSAGFVGERWFSADASAGPGTEHTFQAETRQLLDIVTNSLYTDREVFLRELVSNASDALEKLRHLQATGMAISDPDLPLEINISFDKDAKTLVRARRQRPRPDSTARARAHTPTASLSRPPGDAVSRPTPRSSFPRGCFSGPTPPR